MCLIVCMFDIQLIFSCFVSTEYVPGRGGKTVEVRHRDPLIKGTLISITSCQPPLREVSGAATTLRQRWSRKSGLIRSSWLEGWHDVMSTTQLSWQTYQG